jgi:hypothetical protein
MGRNAEKMEGAHISIEFLSFEKSPKNQEKGKVFSKFHIKPKKMKEF